jgi:hypothetical protein
MSRTRATLQISLPIRNGKGNGRGGIECTGVVAVDVLRGARGAVTR